MKQADHRKFFNLVPHGMNLTDAVRLSVRYNCKRAEIVKAAKEKGRKLGYSRAAVSYSLRTSGIRQKRGRPTVVSARNRLHN